MPIEVSPLAGHILRGDVEFAPLGVNERRHGWQKNERREDGLIYLVPERVAVFPLDTGIGERGKRQMRQRVGENGRHRAVHVAVAEQQVDKRRGQEDQPRQRVKIVDNAIEVAKTLGQRQPAAE